MVVIALIFAFEVLSGLILYNPPEPSHGINVICPVWTFKHCEMSIQVHKTCVVAVKAAFGMLDDHIESWLRAVAVRALVVDEFRVGWYESVLPSPSTEPWYKPMICSRRAAMSESGDIFDLRICVR